MNNYTNKLVSLEEMDKFLETHIKIKSWWNRISKQTNNEQEDGTSDQKLPNNKEHRTRWLHWGFYQIFKEELTAIIPKLFPKIKKSEHFQTYFIRPASPYHQSHRKTLQGKKTNTNIYTKYTNVNFISSTKY